MDKKNIKLEIKEVSKRLHSVANNKKLVTGISVSIASNKWIYFWVILPFIVMLKYKGIDNFIYDLVVSNRNSISVD